MKIGIIGSGFIAKGLYNLILQKEEFEISRILTRSDISKRDDFDKKYLTNSIKDFLSESDLIIECSGTVVYATEVMLEAIKFDKKIITMNTEFNVTVGSYFVDKCYITEAEGDQPGCLAALNEEITEMGFSPVVYGNIKGFLNNNPTLEDMKFWSKKSGISLDMVTSFTDGTKVQMEQAFVANGLNATILKDGLSGLVGVDIQKNGNLLAKKAKNLDLPISDYVVSSEGPPGVFITATHENEQAKALDYYKLGSGPFYTLIKGFHLPHLEIYKTILRVVNGGDILLNNSSHPSISVAAFAKKDMKIGDKITKGIGSFEVRGEAIKIKDYHSHVPIGLLNDAILVKDIKKDSIITFEDVKITNNVALDIWKKILNKVEM